MSLRGARRTLPEAGLAFLDIMTCGFGAIILLLVISQVGGPPDPSAPRAEPTPDIPFADLQTLAAELDLRVAERLGAQAALETLEEARQVAAAELETLERELAEREARELELTQAASRAAAGATAIGRAESALALALQSLTEEMRRLKDRPSPDPVRDVVGGIPVDSEYIVFIIDTSGSMVRFAWDAMIDKMIETLDAYPHVAGIQVMNDMGTYMFPSYRGRFMEDTPARRAAIVKRLRRWNVYSNSSPVEGITAAIRTFYRPDRRVSLYVFGDEFSGGSIQGVIDAVAAINPRDDGGRPQVRIHAVGFPVQFAQAPNLQGTGVRFATLMRALTAANGGAFVGLADYR